MPAYWEKYWNEISNDIDEQSQVGRTVKKIPVSVDVFMRTVNWAAEKMQIEKYSDVLELCCGNGAWTIPFSKRVRHVTAVDFSKPLIDVLKKKCRLENIKNIKVKLQDISTINVEDFGPYSHVLMYFALQHFSEKETIILFENIYKILKGSMGAGCIFYIGDIPDREKLWIFANTQEYVKMYFESVKKEMPSIGTWFIKDDLIRLSEYAGFSKCEIIIQPEWQINSKYRFDMKMEV